MAKKKPARTEDFGEAAAPETTPPAAAPNPGVLSRFQKFEIVRLHRSKMQNAPYNPRIITEDAKKALKKNLEAKGLIEPLIWNETTGNIVGGHQRIKILDSLEGTNDYFLDVAKVTLDPKTEKEQNIFLNNGEAQGDWDYTALDKMFKDDKLDFENTGFSKSSIYQMFGDSPLVNQPEELAAAAERVRNARAIYDQSVQQSLDEDDPAFYCVVVFQYPHVREAFLKALGLEDNRYVDGKFLIQKLCSLMGNDILDRAAKWESVDCDHCHRTNFVEPDAVEATCIHCKQSFPVEREDPDAPEDDDGDGQEAAPEAPLA